MQTEKEVLRSVPGSLLSALFSDMHKLKMIGDEVFIDRDGKTFENLVNYLRNERKVFPEFTNKNEENHFLKELHFWGIDDHNKEWMEETLRKLDKSVVNPNLMSLAQEDTESVNESARELADEERRITESRTTPSEDSSEKGGQEYPSYLDNSYQNIQYEGPYDDGSSDEDDENAGVALKVVKDKWKELGPLKLEEIMAKSEHPISQNMEFGQSEFNKYIIGQLSESGYVTGVGKEINHIIYEGQFKEDIYHGYGRYIYGNGNYYLGQWENGKRHGWGKLVDVHGKVYEGLWKQSKFVGAEDP